MAEKKPAGFLGMFSAPARRALEGIGVSTLAQLERYSDAELLALHGFGPASLPVVRKLVQHKAATSKEVIAGGSRTRGGKKVRSAKDLSPSRSSLPAEGNSGAVDELIAALEPGLREPVEALRRIILGAHKLVDEQVKWNSPAFWYTGNMKPFNPKEYKRDIVVMNLHRGRIMLVFPSGAKVNDTTGLLTGDFKDGRRIVIFSGLPEIRKQSGNLAWIIRQWIALVD